MNKDWLDSKECIDYWEKRSKTYDFLDDVRSSRTAYKIVNIVKTLGINSGAWILDAGCGTGSITKIIRDNFRFANVLGVDLSKGMISKASLRKCSRLKFIHSDFYPK